MRTSLIAALIGVAVLIGVATAIAMRTTTPTTEDTVAGEFGSSSLSVELSGYTPDAEAWVEAELHRVVPDAPTTRVSRQYASFGQVIGADLGDPVLEGKFSIIDGAPPTDGEVALSWDYARRIDRSVGDRWSPPDSSDEYLVSATVVEMGEQGGGPFVLVPVREFLPLAEATTEDDAFRTESWLVSGDFDDRAVSQRINEDWDPVTSDQAQSDFADFEGFAPDSTNVSAQARFYWEQGAFLIYEGLEGRPSVVSSMVAALLLVEVALLAAAAYATGIRRRVREIGLIATQGATRGQIRGSVVVEAMATALVGSIAGAAGAVGLALVARPVAQRVIDPTLTTTVVAPIDIVGPVVLAVVAAVLAAWLPARTASRVPVLTALHGRMPVRAVPRWMMPLSVGLVTVGSLLVIVVRASQGGAGQAQAIVGVILVVLGGVAIGAPLVALFGRMGSGLPVVGRIVVRDTARQSIRATAAIAALMVVLVGSVAAATAVATVAAAREATGDLGGGDARFVFVQGDYDESVDPSRGTPDTLSVSPDDERTIAAILPSAERFDVELLAGAPVLAQFRDGVRRAEDGVGEDYYCKSNGSLGDEYCYGLDSISLPPAVVEPSTLEAMGLDDAASELAHGRPVLLGGADGVAEVDYDGEALDVRQFDTDVTGWSMPALYVPESWAVQRGMMDDARRSVVFVNPEPLTGAERQRIFETDVRASPGLGGVGFDFRETTAALVGVAILVVAIVIAIVVGLSATESDRDIATMVAVGAAPSVRRRFLGRQSALYVSSAAVIAVPLGLLLMTIEGGSNLRVGRFGVWTGGIAVPWLAIVGLVVVAPLVVGFGTRSVVRSLPARPPRRVG